MGGSQSACHRADVNDATALFAKLLCRTFGSQKKSEYIRVELAMKLRFVYVLQRQVGKDAGIVNEYVHIAELLLGLAKEAINLGRSQPTSDVSCESGIGRPRITASMAYSTFGKFLSKRFFDDKSPGRGK